ncbi:ty3-gypsy retrotransposon protein [Cucumis melo var. makuwa]|uniref:Ty3-gypsy retrotransposon protein n=1 Tax=Cucumis melo var. makuwa TaxID=1194695 RepID=A0A5A7SXB8_CUCMM|nr:ty3-gypsy retrotransposon protein [Cucumis melo var. makuwa]TYK21860.1 ty3-gypsy retrotransposon protein [Cucumis melo var. makuwa]
MVDVTAEATMAEIERKINFLMKVVEERDHEIAALKDQMKACETFQQLQDMIANSIRAQYGGPPQTSFMYSKPYTKRIDNLKMPLGYQPPKFQQFDGKGNPKQHIAHFVKTCKNAGSRGDQLVRLFVRSLKGNAFEWYTDLEPEVIDSWEQLEIEFLNRCFSTRRVVNMMKLTNTKQRKGEPVINYINRWRALSLDCKDKLTELSAVEICTQDMLEQLIEKQLIQLPECKPPEQARKVDDPNYCKYHRVISHPIEKCFVLKELILKLARENKIELDIYEVAQTNHVAVNMTSSVPPSILLYDQRESLIHFGTFEPILVRFQQKTMTSNSQNKEESSEDEGQEWIGVAHKKERQTSSVQTNSHFHQKH